ncbi:MAG: leucine-rich repeat domain-containing protein [Treponema sp.]|nr:leucine-rich repeat domain-containing protein [Treponema sp.]
MILSAFLLSSCSFDGAGSDTTDGTSVSSGSSVVTVTGSLNAGGALPKNYANLLSQTSSENSSVQNDSNIANSAFPSIPATGITYTVTAVNTASGSTESYTGEAITVDGSLFYRVGIPVPATAKNYKIKVSAIYDESEILTGESEGFTISTSSPVASKNVTLSAAQSTGGKGNVALEIDVSGTQITKGMCSFCSTPYNVSDGKITVGVNLLDSQTYSGTFYFYDNSDTVLYKFKEKVNVFDGLTTNTWVQNGNEPWFVTTGTGASKTTTCRITSAMVEGFELTEIVVDSSVADSGSGTFLHPVKTFDEAVAKIHNKDKDYTIFIKGELTGSHEIPATLKTDGSGTYNAKTLTLCGYNGLNGSGVPQDSLNGNFDSDPDGVDDGYVLGISTTVPVTITNLLITGGNCNTNAGGIYNSGNLTLKNGCVISGNRAKWGGGIYNGEYTGLGISPELHIEGATCRIENNDSFDTGYEGGAGININAGSVTMTAGTICANTAAVSTGGGIYICSGGSFTMSGGTISGNSAANDGGAVYVADGADFNISGSAYIPYGVIESGTLVKGAGKNDVYLASNKTITIAGAIEVPSACTDGIIARITPQTYLNDSDLHLLSESTSGLISSYYSKFAVTPDSTGKNYYIDNSGLLKEGLAVSAANAASAISGLTGSQTLIITGEINDTLLAAIVTSINSSALTSINLDISLTSGLTSIAENRFKNCTKLTQILLPTSNLTSIASNAFDSCSSLTGITIPESIKTIGDSAFSSCTAITSVTIPAGVSKIGKNVFAGASSLTSITFEETSYWNVTDSETYRDGEAADVSTPATNASNLNNTSSAWYNKYLYMNAVSAANAASAISGLTESQTFVITGNITSSQLAEIKTAISSLGEEVNVELDLTNVTGLTSLSNEAFKDCTHLSAISLPNTITSIASNAFVGCTALTAINIEEENTYFTSSDGVLFNNDSSVLLCHPAAKTVTDSSNYYQIPATVTEIGSYAFSNCQVSIWLINNGEYSTCTKIGDYAFQNTTTSILITQDITYIGKDIKLNGSGNLTIKQESTGTKWYYTKNGTETVYEGDITLYADGQYILEDMRTEGYFSLTNDEISYFNGTDETYSGATWEKKSE